MVLTRAPAGSLKLRAPGSMALQPQRNGDILLLQQAP